MRSRPRAVRGRRGSAGRVPRSSALLVAPSSGSSRNAQALRSNGRSPAAAGGRPAMNSGRLGMRHPHVDAVGAARRRARPASTLAAPTTIGASVAARTTAICAADVAVAVGHRRRAAGCRARRASRAHFVPGRVPAPMPSVIRPPLIRCTLLAARPSSAGRRLFDVGHQRAETDRVVHAAERAEQGERLQHRAVAADHRPVEVVEHPGGAVALVLGAADGVAQRRPVVGARRCTGCR